MLNQRNSLLLSLFRILGLSLLLLTLLFNVHTASASERTDQTSYLFLQAIDHGDLDTAQSLLNSGADINYTHGGKLHALGVALNWHRGTKYTTPEIVRFLISRGANVNARFCYGWNYEVKNVTPLMRSMQSNYTSPEAISILIANGADINAEDSEGNNVLYYAVRYLHNTGWAGSKIRGSDVIDFLVSKGADLNHRNNKGVTPFIELIATLPSEGANVNSRYLTMVKNMIRFGADVNLSINGIKPIDIAFKTNNIPVYQYLLAVENGTAPKEEPQPVKSIQQNKAPVAVKKSLPKSELNIGGITFGQAMDYVEQVYGKPGVVDDQGYFQIYNYNDLFVVTGKLNNGYRVASVVTYEKEVATPSGFRVGMPFADVVKKYGDVKPVKFKAEGLDSKLKGCKDYTYFCDDGQLVFLVDKNQVIRAIKIEPLDQEKYKTALTVK